MKKGFSLSSDNFQKILNYFSHLSTSLTPFRSKTNIKSSSCNSKSSHGQNRSTSNTTHFRMRKKRLKGFFFFFFFFVFIFRMANVQDCNLKKKYLEIILSSYRNYQIACRRIKKGSLELCKQSRETINSGNSKIPTINITNKKTYSVNEIGVDIV